MFRPWQAEWEQRAGELDEARDYTNDGADDSEEYYEDEGNQVGEVEEDDW